MSDDTLEARVRELEGLLQAMTENRDTWLAGCQMYEQRLAEITRLRVALEEIRDYPYGCESAVKASEMRRIASEALHQAGRGEGNYFSKRGA